MYFLYRNTMREKNCGQKMGIIVIYLLGRDIMKGKNF